MSLSLNLSLCSYSPAIRPETLAEEPIKQRLADMLILNRGLIGTLPRELHSLPQSPKPVQVFADLLCRYSTGVMHGRPVADNLVLVVGLDLRHDVRVIPCRPRLHVVARDLLRLVRLDRVGHVGIHVSEDPSQQREGVADTGSPE